ncbi:MAG TPA: hemerythrin domain-containing protein [Pirellulales bacterium]|nr:hemerythrin domain-containing protein [Pirellulales bacterium]
MVQDEVAQQAYIEHEMLKHIAGALRATMEWKLSGEDLSRKLASLRFIGESFQRHVEHVFDLEEYDGYMAVVTESHPHLHEKTAALREEHDQMRRRVRGVLYNLRHLESDDAVAFGDACQELLSLLDHLNDHNHREMALIQEAMTRDMGGEG